MAFNILVVDDSATMRAVIKKTVGMTGIQVGELFEAGNGKEALTILANEWVDVVLSDINMPEMGGVEFFKEAKKDDVLRDIPVIFISTESSAARIKEAEAMGVAGYVKKPFQPALIKNMLLDVLNKAYATRMVEEGTTPIVSSAVDDNLDF
nr:response regulator [Desulfobulbaceae bacterium]